MNNLINNLNKIKPGKNLLNYKEYLSKYIYDDYTKYVKINKNTYNKELVYKNNLFDMYIINWGNRQKSKIHNHSTNGCLFKILEGNIIEHRYDIKNLELISSVKFKKNSISYIDDNLYYHKMENLFEKPCVSLHIYSPPDFKCTYYDK
jgi:cysteine dioxygenase